jgi:hypothetical protein
MERSKKRINNIIDYGSSYVKKYKNDNISFEIIVNSPDQLGLLDQLDELYTIREPKQNKKN